MRLYPRWAHLFVPPTPPHPSCGCAGALKQPTGVSHYDDARGVYVNEKHWYQSKVGWHRTPCPPSLASYAFPRVQLQGSVSVV